MVPALRPLEVRLRIPFGARMYCTSLVATLSFPVQDGGLQWADHLPREGNAFKRYVVLTVNRNRTDGLWKVRRQKRRINKDIWKHQNFIFNVELISVQSVEN